MVKLRDLNEKDFIRDVLSKYADTAAVEKYDDCIVVDLAQLLDLADLPYMVYSMDHPSQIRRPLPSDMKWRFYGRWVAGCTCGDVLAMGAKPRGFSLDFATSLDIEVDVIEQIYQGIGDVLDHYDTALEGGNLDIADGLEMVGLAWGLVGRDNIIRRSGAQVGDYVATTAVPGVGWASFLLSHYGKLNDLDDVLRDYLVAYNLLPVAPAQAIVEAAAIPGAVTSGMDLTDGLIEFLYTIRERNGFGVRVYEDWLPVSSELRQAADVLGLQPTALSLEPGYDTPLIHGYTVAPAQWQEVERVFAKHNMCIHRVGEVCREPDVQWIRADGKSRQIPKFWDDQFEKESIVDRWQDLVAELH